MTNPSNINKNPDSVYINKQDVNKISNIQDILKRVRDAGAQDDNNGAEDWSHSDQVIAEANQALFDDISKYVLGEDEQIETTDGFGNTRMIDSPLNDLKAEQRKRLAEYMGVEG